jgi:hypothetical protein
MALPVIDPTPLAHCRVDLFVRYINLYMTLLNIKFMVSPAIAGAQVDAYRLKGQIAPITIMT